LTSLRCMNETRLYAHQAGISEFFRTTVRI
jgi:hypothetical protein